MSREDVVQVDEPLLLHKELRAHLSVIEQKIDRLTLKVGKRHADVEASPAAEAGAASQAPSKTSSKTSTGPGAALPGALHLAPPAQRSLSRPSTASALPAGDDRGPLRHPSAGTLQAWAALAARPSSSSSVLRGLAQAPRPQERPTSSSSGLRGIVQSPRPQEPGPLAAWAAAPPQAMLQELPISRGRSYVVDAALQAESMDSGLEFSPRAGRQGLEDSAGRTGVGQAPTTHSPPKLWRESSKSEVEEVRVATDSRRRRSSMDSRQRRASTVASISRGRHSAPEPMEGRRATGRRDSVVGPLRRGSLASSMSTNSDQVQLGRLRSFMKLPLDSTKGFGFREQVTKTLGLGKMTRASSSLSFDYITSSWLYQAVHGNFFSYFCSSVIMLNVVAIGVTADTHLKAELNNEKLSPAFEYLDWGFAAFFTAELLLRMLSELRLFIWGPEWKWNLFDSILVTLSCVDIVVTNTLDDAAVRNLAAGRILRFVRFIRIVRIARAVRAFHSLRIVVYAIFESMLSLIWCFLVVLLIIYMFAIFFLYGVTEHIEFGNPPAQELQTLREFYGSVPRAIVTLFMTISGGVDWSDAVQPLLDINWLYEPVFNFYVFFMVIGVLNVVVGAFVAATADISARDRDFLVKNEINQLQAYAGKVKTFFKEADKDRSGNLSWGEFKEYLKVPKVSAFFQSLELDVGQAHLIFKLLDGDGSNEVNIDEFLQGCMRLKGAAKSLDMNMLLYENRRMQEKLDGFLAVAAEKLGESATEEMNDNPISDEDGAPQSPGGIPRFPVGVPRIHLGAPQAHFGVPMLPDEEV